jgi:hypothetical protein
MNSALRLRRRARHVLWGGRRGDLQLGRRTGLELASRPDQGLPAGSTCIGAEYIRDAYWFWIPVA